jgi:hypothetical protein
VRGRLLGGNNWGGAFVDVIRWVPNNRFSRDMRMISSTHLRNNWAGTPLRTWESFLAAIRGATTQAGLIVEAVLNSAPYKTGASVTDALMSMLNMQPHATCPAGNYTLRPRQPASP